MKGGASTLLLSLSSSSAVGLWLRLLPTLCLQRPLLEEALQAGPQRLAPPHRLAPPPGLAGGSAGGDPGRRGSPPA